MTCRHFGSSDIAGVPGSSELIGGKLDQVHIAEAESLLKECNEIEFENHLVMIA